MSGSTLALLKSLEGKGAISGQFTEIRGMAQIASGGAIATIESLAGKWPGMIGGDYWWFGSTQATADLTFNALAIAYAAAGGLVTLSLSMPNPTTAKFSGDATALDSAGLLAAGTATHQALLVMLDSIAAGLAQLQAAGVTVLLRPFHELNGTWFWWSLLPPAQFVSLWQFVRDYLTKSKGLTNLLWVWSVNAGFVSYPPQSRYPGDAYVDVTGIDVYSSNPADAAGDVATLVALGHPVMLSEFGSGSAAAADPTFEETTLIAALKGPLSKIVAWQQWWSPWGMETAAAVKPALADPWVLNRGDLASGAAVAAPTSASSTILTTASGGSVTDATNNVWTLTAAGIVERDGVAVAGGAGTGALAVIDGVVYAQDATSEVWFSNIGGVWAAVAAFPGQTAPPNTTPPTTPTPGSAPPVVTPPTVTHLTLAALVDQAAALLEQVRQGLAMLLP